MEGRTQIKELFLLGESSGELPHILRAYSEHIQNSLLIESTSSEWQRLDKIVDTKIAFKVVAQTLDFPLGRDKNGFIYVTKDHAIDVLSHEAYQAKSEAAQASDGRFILTIVLFLIVAVAVLGRIFK